MPTDAAPRPDAATPSSRNAVRGGILAAVSTPPAPEAAAVVPAAEPAPAPLAEAATLPVQPPPGRGAVGVLRAAGRRGLRAARPLAAPFLHRLQMRFRTAVNESDVAARTAGIEGALAGLSQRLDDVGGDLAERLDSARRDLGDRLNKARRDLDASTSLRLEALAAALGERTGAARREAAEAAAVNARRLDALGAALAERTDAFARRLDAIERAVAAAPDVVQSRLPLRAPLRVGEEFLVRTPDGNLLLPAEDLRLLAAMSEGGVLEPGTRRVLSALLRPGGAFLDVGAHAGTMTLLGARRVGEGGRVFAVEPLPRLAALLRRSMALNDLAERVSVEACAAGDAEAEGVLHIGEVMGESSLLPLTRIAETGTARVPVRRLDDVVPAGTPIDVAKIDAEGTELRVWRGMGRVLEESPGLAAVLEFGPSHLARAGVAPEEWLGELEASGFEAHAIDEDTGACRRASAPALAGVVSVNILLLRPGAAARHPGLAFA